MLKDKVEQPNYSELCEKALKFVMDGIDLPKINKTPAEEAADMFNKTFLLDVLVDIYPRYIYVPKDIVKE
jgi:hypothetical protein